MTMIDGRPTESQWLALWVAIVSPRYITPGGAFYKLGLPTQDCYHGYTHAMRAKNKLKGVTDDNGKTK